MPWNAESTSTKRNCRISGGKSHGTRSRRSHNSPRLALTRLTIRALLARPRIHPISLTFQAFSAEKCTLHRAPISTRKGCYRRMGHTRVSGTRTYLFYRFCITLWPRYYKMKRVVCKMLPYKRKVTQNRQLNLEFKTVKALCMSWSVCEKM